MKGSVVATFMESLYDVISPDVFWILSLLVALGLSILAGSRDDGLKPRTMACAAAWGIIGAFWGGYLLNLLATAPRELFENPLLLLRFMEGNKGVFSAFVGAGLFGWGYLRWKKASCFSYADAAMPAIALGYAVARIGCFFNGCCFGTPSGAPWAVRFPQNTMAFYEHWSKGWVQSNDVFSLPIHPTQLYHSVVGLFIFLLLRKWQGRWFGSRVTLGLATYGFLRFFLQFIRGNRTPLLGFLDINQIFSLLFLLLAGMLWWNFGRQQTAASKVMSVLPSTDAYSPEGANVA